MPYISTESVKRIRETIKKEFPEFKFSITKHHHSSVHVHILSGPIEMITNTDGHRYESVNQFYIAEHYKDFPEVRDILLKIYKIVNEGNYAEVWDGDYGAVPSFYVNIRIGDYDKPYEIKTKKSKKQNLVDAGGTKEDPILSQMVANSNRKYWS